MTTTIFEDDPQGEGMIICDDYEREEVREVLIEVLREKYGGGDERPTA